MLTIFVDSYEKILSHVLSRCDSRSVHRLKGIFGWIAFAKRPLQISELQSALLFDATSNVADRPVPNYVLEACGPLVERRKDSTICFIHVSVKEYVSPSGLVKARSLADAHLEPIVRYLQRDDCVEAVRLSRQASLWDNGLSSLRCLQRAFEVFGPSTPELARNIQVLRGVWAFLPYTRDTWFSELREMASVPKEEWSPLFWDIAQQLSRVLTASRPSHATVQTVASIPGLDAIRSLESLWSEAAASLVAESKGEILAAGANDSGKPTPAKTTHSITMLSERRNPRLLQTAAEDPGHSRQLRVGDPAADQHQPPPRHQRVGARPLPRKLDEGRLRLPFSLMRRRHEQVSEHQ